MAQTALNTLCLSTRQATRETRWRRLLSGNLRGLGLERCPAPGRGDLDDPAEVGVEVGAASAAADNLQKSDERVHTHALAW